jgi:hypothetical protein
VRVSALPDTSLIDRAYEWFADAEQCAKSAAPLYVSCGWIWTDQHEKSFVPTEEQLLKRLNELKRDLSVDGAWIASGRLAYWPEQGFGHEAPRPIAGSEFVTEV